MHKSTDLLVGRMQEAFRPHGALAEFCRKTGFPRKTVENWIQGTTIPTTALDTIAFGLGLQTWELLKPEGAAATPSRAEILGKCVQTLTALDDGKLRRVLRFIDVIQSPDAPADAIDEIKKVAGKP